MARTTDGPLIPRNGHTLIVARVARISGCANQKEMSLDDQMAHYVDVVENLYKGPAEFIDFATVGKGESLERPELALIEDALRSGKVDLLIVEDLGRLVRGAEAVWLFGIGIDYGVRGLAPDDGIDTNDPTWERDALNAAAEHVAHNTHTSTRIKQKQMRRFKAHGGAMPLPIFSYIVPDDAETLDDWKIDPVHTDIVMEGFAVLLQTLNCSAVADMFNERGTPVGPYCRNIKWDGAMVRRFYGNTLLKGEARRGMKYTYKHNESGKRRLKKSEKPAEVYRCPHLAQIKADDFDELNALLDEKNKNIGRKPTNGKDPLLSVPRKRTRFPGQWSRCAYCGNQHVWGGNGITKNLMCSGSREWNCWNSVGFDGALAARRIVELITTELATIDDNSFAHAVEQARQRHGGGADGDALKRLLEEEQRVASEERNIADAIARFGAEPSFDAKLKEIRERRAAIMLRRRQYEATINRVLNLPASAAELRTKANEAVASAAIESYEFGDVLRQFVPEIHVYLVRACDGGHLLPRAKVRLAFDGIIPDARHAPEVSAVLKREATIDLFEPAQRVLLMTICGHPRSAAAPHVACDDQMRSYTESAGAYFNIYLNNAPCRAVNNCHIDIQKLPNQIDVRRRMPA